MVLHIKGQRRSNIDAFLAKADEQWRNFFPTRASDATLLDPRVRQIIETAKYVKYKRLDANFAFYAHQIFGHSFHFWRDALENGIQAVGEYF